MSDLLLIAVLVIFFGLAIALVRVLGAMIDRDPDPGAFGDEPPEAAGHADGRANNGRADQAGWSR